MYNQVYIVNQKHSIISPNKTNVKHKAKHWLKITDEQ